MIKNYLLVAIRNTLRNKSHSLINVLGLAIGMAATIIVLLYLDFQFGVDQHIPNVENIYRVVRHRNPTNREPFVSTGTLGPVGPALAEGITGITRATRFVNRPMWAGIPDRSFAVQAIAADANFLDFFSIRVLHGSSLALEQPNAVFITQSVALKLFGDADPINQTISLYYKWVEDSFRVAGILEDPKPGTSRDLKFDLVFNHLAMHEDQIEFLWESWRVDSDILIVRTFVELQRGLSASTISQQLKAFALQHLGSSVSARDKYSLYPFSRQYLHAKEDIGLPLGGFEGSHIQDCYTYGFLGALVLLIACINFVNLATSRSTLRAAEVGMRKSVGATPWQLQVQFLIESILTAVASAVVALLLVLMALPTVRSLIGKPLEVGLSIIVIIFPITALVGIIAGIYPAFFLASTNAVQALRGRSKSDGSGRLRQGLVIFQFAAAIMFTIITLVTYRQADFVRSQNLGYNIERCVILPVFSADRSLREKYEIVRQSFSNHPNILSISAAHSPPGDENTTDRTLVTREGQTDSIVVYHIAADENYLGTLDIPLLRGRNLTLADMWKPVMMLNETAVRALGPEFKIGDVVKQGRSEIKLVGVFSDFHNASLHSPIRPLMIIPRADFYNLILRIRGERVSETISFLETTWHRFIPTRTFQYQMFDERIETLYAKETQMRQVSAILTGLAISVACLGLFGLVNFATRTRMKEIGVRKILGASLLNIVVLILKDFIILLAIAIGLAWPGAWYLSHEWLESYFYRISLGPDLFIAGGLLALLIVLVTTIGPVIKAAQQNPTTTLRSE